jgi:hypothetical protein
VATGFPALPDVTMPAVEGPAVRLADAVGAAGVLVVVHTDCPTSALALRRLGAAAGAGELAAVLFEDELDAAARAARTARFAGPVLSEPPPYEVSRRLAVEAVPTALLVEHGAVVDRVVGWDAGGYARLLARAARARGTTSPPLADEEPQRKPGCGSRIGGEPAIGGAFDELEEMYERGWTDGLPAVPPTPARVEAMLAGRDGDAVLGPVPPGGGEATVARVAACAVLAGCRPEYFPVVLATAEAALDPRFNLHGLAVTTQPAGPVVLVHGPARERLGLNAGMGALGPGHRANATIGRALRLMMTLTGGAEPGRLDRATLGQPGKVGMCLAELEEASPWPPLHAELGFAAGASVVTLLAADAPLSISDHRSSGPEELARVFAAAAGATWSPNWWPLDTPSLFVVCPEHAALFAGAGWTRADVRDAIFAAARRPARELRWGETTPLVHAADDDEPVPKWDRANRILLLVAGGEAGRYSAVLGPCLGMDWEPVSKEIAWTT